MPELLPKNLQDSIFQKIKELERVADEIPGVIIIHLIQDLSVQYISRRGQEYLGLTLEKIKQLGDAYYANYFNPEDFEDYAPKVRAMFERNNPDELVSFFQQVRNGANTPWTWHFSTSKIFVQDPDGNPLLSITISLPVDPTQHVTTKLEHLLEDYIFFRKHKKLYLSLTGREQEILKLLALSKSATEIAEQLVISPLTVETHRKNLRKKLKITSGYELNKFARAFDLI
jgi:DNA-binding CsgD family transcriptional regulator